MKVYRQPAYPWLSLLVFDFGRSSFRIGYTKRQDIAVAKYVSERIVVLSLWLFCLFLQVDWTRKVRV